jgi:hypothetical protein
MRPLVGTRSYRSMKAKSICLSFYYRIGSSSSWKFLRQFSREKILRQFFCRIHSKSNPIVLHANQSLRLEFQGILILLHRYYRAFINNFQGNNILFENWKLRIGNLSRSPLYTFYFPWYIIDRNISCRKQWKVRGFTVSSIIFCMSYC